MARPLVRLSALCSAALLFSILPARAAVTRVSGPVALFVDGRDFVKFDAAHDPINHVYLVAYGTQALGPVNGILLSESGVALTPLFALSDGPMQSGWARIIYSAEQSRFLVSYVKIVGVQHHQKAARFVTISNNTAVLGPELILDDWVGNSGTATGMAYAAGSGKFLVTWSHYFIGAVGAPQVPNSFVSIIDPISGQFTSATAISNPFDGESDPELDCDPGNRVCLVVGTSWGNATNGKSTFWSRYIDDTTGVPVDANLNYVLWGGAIDPPAVVFAPASAAGPAHFLMGLGMGGLIQGMVADGTSRSYTALFTMIQDTTTTGTQGAGYGFLSMRSNRASQTVIATMTSWIGWASVQELTSTGARASTGFDLIPDTPAVASKPWDSANQFTVPAVNQQTGAFAVFENHYFNTLRVSTYTTGQVIPPPVVTQNPVTVKVVSGAIVSFNASAVATPAPSVVWQVSTDNVHWANLSAGFTSTTNGGGTTSTTLVQQVHRADNSKLYRAVFTSNGVSTIGLPAQVLVSPPALNDMDGDGRSDLLVWRPSDSTWHWSMSSSTSVSAPPAAFGSSALGDIALTGDLDGDGAADIVIWRSTTGTWFWLPSSTSYSVQGQLTFGGPGDVPMLADMDGDGLSDLVIWRPSTGGWYWLTSKSGFTQGSAIGFGGTPGDVPLLGDVDGDGKADLIIWRPGGYAVWYVLLSSTNYSYSTGVRAMTWGTSGDQPLVGDFDGDGKVDLAVWRPGDGTWYWLNSSSGYSATTQGRVQWGIASLGDIPLLADFDGDGRVDIVVWRSSTGHWYWLGSTVNYSTGRAGEVVFGGPGDIPIVR